MPEKRATPTIAEFASNYLDADKLDHFLDFVSFVKKNQLGLRKGAAYSWGVFYKGVFICNLDLYGPKRYKPDGNWDIRPKNLFFDEYDRHVTDAEEREFILNAINFIKCRGCDGSGCMGRDNLTIFGKNFKNVCNGFPLLIISPEGEALENAKKLVLATKDIIEAARRCERRGE